MTVTTGQARRLSQAEWRRWEQVGLKPSLDLDELVLNWTDYRVKDLDARGALVDLKLDRTIEGASTITITLRDPAMLLTRQRQGRMRPREKPIRNLYKRDPVRVDEGWEAIYAPDVIGRAVEVELDGVVFRLVKARSSSATAELQLTFEDRIVYWLRRKYGARAASRADVTRAEFILSLLREVKSWRYRFVCPELHDRQPIDRPDTTATRALRVVRTTSATGTGTTTGDDDGAGGFPTDANVTVKGVKATPDQLRNLDGVLSECQAQGCSRGVMVATVCCVTQESTAKRLGYGDAAGPDSRGLFQQRATWGSLQARLDPRRSCRMFLTGGDGGQPGWKQKHGDLTHVPGSIESAVKAVQVSVGGYGQWENEASKTVSAWGGAGAAEGDAAGGGTYAKSYQFERKADEDSWTAMQRLAEEVGWRCFVVGNSVYYMSEQQLYQRRARYQVTPDDPAVHDVSYDVDWGKPVSEATLNVSLERWGAPPGSVVLLDGFGPADGRWLVTGLTRGYFDVTADVTLQQPGKEKLEPAHELVQRAANASEAGDSTGTTQDASKAGRLYRECKRISDAGGPYYWGGGHGVSFSSIKDGDGLDCSGSVCLALKRAGMFPFPYALVSGDMASQWGEPGEGSAFTVWANSQHVWIQLKTGNAWRFDTSPYGDGERGPRLRSTSRPTAGFTARHWPGT